MWERMVFHVNSLYNQYYVLSNTIQSCKIISIMYIVICYLLYSYMSQHIHQISNFLTWHFFSFLCHSLSSKDALHIWIWQQKYSKTFFLIFVGFYLPHIWLGKIIICHIATKSFRPPYDMPPYIALSNCLSLAPSRRVEQVAKKIGIIGARFIRNNTIKENEE